MANTIALAKKYVALLDEVYKETAKTAVLESDASLAQQGANANEIIIPKLDMDGLGDYDRNSGYTTGSVTLTNETVKFNYERGRMFQVDAMDNEESQNIAFGRLAGEFIRTKVVPEIDAFRFATLAGITGISKVAAGATLADGAAVITALRAATNKMDEDEVPMEDRILFITPTLYGAVQDLDTTKSKEVLARFSQVIQVPQSRFYTAIDLKDGKTEGEEAGGYVKATAGKDINFIIAHKPAVIQYTKHAVPKIITPELNQDADAWKYGYRNYGLEDVYENKVAGIYLHHKA
ncbi:MULTISPECIES: hypothetical protein [unclassified Clostridium]|uniref:hypothetical protein n=1 Tax=unclassified Clostridium TaxID=2614128 RepID=UPI00290D43BC|nr:hypothetical protein [Clostridium sp.]MDU5106525.1 hypothetical protein [Clostridium sp.]